ncbi:MAG: CoA transferase [Acidimicrobiales bacterium]
MPGLEGVRVTEAAGGVAAAWTAKLFADLGAEVIRVEDLDPELDGVRRRPHQLDRWLNTNKASVTSGLAGLAAEADLLIHDLGPAAARARGLDLDGLAKSSPSLVIASVSPFGLTGPYADYRAEELTLMHGGGWGWLTPGASDRADLPPLKPFGHQACIQAGTLAAIAALAALDRAERTGLGEHLDFSVFAAIAKMTETAPVSYTYLGANPTRLGVRTLNPWGIYACSDGLIQFICVEEEQWRSLVELMGNPEWTQLDVVATFAERNENPDVVNMFLAEWFAGWKVEDLYREGQRRRLCMSPVRTMADLTADAGLAARNFFAAVDGLTLPGPLFQADQPWWGLRRPAPKRGEHDGGGFAARAPRAAARPQPTPATGLPSASAGRPLEGVRICDFTWIWAGPYCCELLSHLGAEVIKLESLDHLDLTRRLPFHPAGVEPSHDTPGTFHQWSAAKKSVQVNLRHPAGQEAIRRLVARSDVVVDNFEVGAMAKLGFGVDDVRRLNPQAVVASVSGYGQTGLHTGYMAYGPAGGALSGLSSLTGYEDGPPVELGIALGDPASGLAMALGIVAALFARRRGEPAARIDVAMVEAVAATVGEGWMAHALTGEQRARAGNRDLVWAPHNCYRARGEDDWLTIAVTTDEEWASLCRVVGGGLDGDARFATAADRKANEAALDERIAAWAADQDRWDATRALQAAGVAAFPSLSPADLYGGDAQLEARGFLERPDHPLVGRRTVPGIPWIMHRSPNGLQAPAPLLGQHTEEILVGLLGYSEAEVAALRESGALR